MKAQLGSFNKEKAFSGHCDNSWSPLDSSTGCSSRSRGGYQIRIGHASPFRKNRRGPTQEQRPLCKLSFCRLLIGTFILSSHNLNILPTSLASVLIKILGLGLTLSTSLKHHVFFRTAERYMWKIVSYPIIRNKVPFREKRMGQRAVYKTKAEYEKKLNIFKHLIQD